MNISESTKKAKNAIEKTRCQSDLECKKCVMLLTVIDFMHECNDIKKLDKLNKIITTKSGLPF